MAFEDYKQKDSIVLVYTGDSKGKTSASLGLMARSLGHDWRVAYIQFIKNWIVGEHVFIDKIRPVFGEALYFHKGGRGFYEAGELSAKNVTEKEHKQAARETFDVAMDCATSGKYDLVICDEINNALHDGLLEFNDVLTLIESRGPRVNLCLTGRNFPKELVAYADIITDMTKIKHHFDDKYLAKEGIDY